MRTSTCTLVAPPTPLEALLDQDAQDLGSGSRAACRRPRPCRACRRGPPRARRPCADPARPLLGAEQLELHAFGRHGGGVDARRTDLGARRLGVDHPCRELLAAARRAGDQHAAVRGGDLVDRLAQLIDGGRVADHVERVAAPLAQLAILAPQTRRLERPVATRSSRSALNGFSM